MSPKSPVPSPPSLTMGDSAVVALRGCQSVLEGRHLDPFPQPTYARILGGLVNKFPKNIRILAADRISASIGHPGAYFAGIDPAKSAEWVVRGYPKEKYPGVILGAPGLAVTFLSGITGFPYLPQPLLYNARKDMDPDNAEAHLREGLALASSLLKKFSDIEATVHFDPVHDRFLIRRLVFIRLKYITLPEAYIDFIKNHLEPGSTVILPDCSYPWPRAEVSERCFYQLGGLGGIPPYDFLNEENYLKEYRAEWWGSKNANWKVGHEFRESPESEWGTVGDFIEEAGNVADRLGHRVIRVGHNHPQELSRLVFDLYRKCHAGSSEISGVYLGTFTHTEPRFPLISGLLPLWVPFITNDGLEFSVETIKNWQGTDGISPSRTDAYITLHPSFCSPPDIVNLDEWKSRLGGFFREINFLGNDQSKYPEDLGAYVRMYPDVLKWSGRLAKKEASFKIPTFEKLASVLTPRPH